MVLVTGPLGGFDASGSLAKSIVFSKWKGRNYVRRLVTPSNPKSGSQVGVRSMFKFLAQQWANISASEQASWDTLAAASTVSPFNAYMGFNQARWRNFLPPFQDATQPAGDAVGTSSLFAATAGVRQITITNDLSLVNENWGRIIFKGATGFATAFSNAIAIIRLDSLTIETPFVDTPLVAAAYFYNGRDIALNGVLGAELGEITATVS